MVDTPMSDFLEWSDKYATGIGTIDGEHRTLFMMVNALHAAAAHDDEELDLAEPLRHLSDYVETHFAREEQLMAAAGYHSLKAHCDEHRALANTVAGFVAEYRASAADFPMDDFLDFLSNWLTHHVLKSDMDYVPHLTGKPPAE